MRIAIYCRVSTEEQNNDSQLLQLRAFAAAQNWEIAAEFVDTITGGTADRPSFNSMFESAQRREFELLLFWSLDRLTREGVLPTLKHLERLASCGISYKSFLEQYLDSRMPFNDTFIAMRADQAKQEKLRISDRTKAGLAAARARGVRLGAKPIEIDTAKLAALRARGLSGRACARQLGVSETTLRNRRAS